MANRIDEYTGWQYAEDQDLGDGYGPIVDKAPGKIHFLYWVEAGGIRKPWVALYRCPCGCGHTSHIPVNDTHDPGNNWGLVIDGDKVTLTPSIQALYGCKSHYFIEANQVKWA